MKLALTVYTDDSLTEVKRIVEAEKLKIPYRVAMYIGQSLDGIENMTTDDLFKFVVNSLDKVDKIIKATIGVSETELECVDAAELGNVAVELYKWGIDKMNGMKGGGEKNA